MAGATPKDTRSASESYCSPNSEVECVIRAMRPSRPSRTPAAMISAAASSKVPRMEHQIERYPQKRLPTVKSVGRMKRPRESRSREMPATSAAPRPAGDGGPPGLELVAARDEDLRAMGQEEAHARAEADQADPLAPNELVAHAGVEQDPAREGPGDLLERDASGRGDQGDAGLLVLDRGLL